MLRVRPTPFGRAAVDRLASLIAETKTNDPLAPVVVLVPTNYAAVSVRRQLASGAHGAMSDRGRGLVGIDFLTPYRLAELFGAPSLAARGRRPVSTPVVAAAVRGILTTEPGMFAEVVEHPSTERALVRAHRELRDLDDHQLDTLVGRSARASEVVRIHRAVDAALETDWYDEFDLLRAATELFGERPDLLAERGHLILYLPLDISLTSAAMLSRAAETVGLTVLAGLTGDVRADAPTAEVARRLGSNLPDVEMEPVAAHYIVSASDADDEVRAAVRAVVNAVLEGVPLHRMAILHGHDVPYARLLEEQLDAAEIAHNGETTRTLSSSLCGRALTGLLTLADHDHRRTDVLDLLATAPIRLAADTDRLVPVNAWERVARRAGIVGGRREWGRRLQQLVDDHQVSIDEFARTEPDAPRRGMLEREQAQARQLAEFVDELVGQVDPAAAPTTWSGLTAWAKQLLVRYLGPLESRSDWPKVELDAADRLDALLDSMAGLDHVEPATSLAVFRRTLELELDAPIGRRGTFGQGVFVGRIGQALGLDLDRVFVVGMAEGVFPSRHSDDSLLPDHERVFLEGALPLRGGDVDVDHRAFLAALAAADHRTLLFPRGDLRRSNERVHSRWLLDSVERATGSRRQPEQLHADARDTNVEWIDEVPSFVSGLRRAEFPATDQEYNLASLLRHLDDGGRATEHELASQAAPYAAGIELIDARSSRRFTRFDGNLQGLTTRRGVGTEVVSPTRLEAWVKCPHRYLYGDVLRIAPVERPDEELRITALDKGNLVHDVLDRFITEEIANGSDGYTTSDGPAAAQRLRSIAEAECDRMAARGLVGKDIFWRRDRAALISNLMSFLAHDLEANPGHQIERTELGFGVAGADRPPVEIVLPSGRAVSFRGAVDRVDRRPDGQVVVIDYKTGSPNRFSGLSESDPVKGGLKLQLPIYAAAAEAAYGVGATSVHAAYWFIAQGSAKWRWIGYDVTPEVMGVFGSIVETVIDGIEAGIFPARPAPNSNNGAYIECPYCDPDGLGTVDLLAQWHRKKSDPALATYLGLAEPDTVSND